MQTENGAVAASQVMVLSMNVFMLHRHLI